MAYTKTAKIIAGMDARRAAFIATARDIISNEGIAGLTTNAIAEHADLSAGLLYKYYADIDELIAAVVQQQLDRDLTAIFEATADEETPVDALTAALTVLYERMTRPRLVYALAGQPAYAFGMRATLERMILAALDVPPKGAQLAAAGALGALFVLSGLGEGRARTAPEAVLFALRGIGIGDAAARRAVERLADV